MKRTWMVAGVVAWGVLLTTSGFGSDFPIYWAGPQGEAFRAAADDVDGDGTADLLLVSLQGSPTSPQQAFVRSGLNGSLLHTWIPSLPNFWAFSDSVRKPAGDLNVDGFNDVALSIVNTTTVPGQVLEVRSGLDGSVMAIIPPPILAASLIGFSIAGAGDLDGDGSQELLVSGYHPLPGCMTYGQVVYDFEGPAFALQFYVTPWQCGQNFGSQIGRLDDVDGDGLPDFYVGAPLTDAGGIFSAGWIGVFSGATGSLIASMSGSTTNEFLGASLAGLGDVTGDGMPELVAARLGGLNQLAVLSLPNLLPAYVLSPAAQVDSLGDADGDGMDDYLIRRWTPALGEWIAVLSGPTGAPIGEVAQNFPGGTLTPFGGLGDVNGDGLGDFAATPGIYLGTVPPYAAQGLWSPWSWPVTDGAVRVYVSPNLGVAGTPTVGGSAQFQVVAPKRPGRPFQLVFSQDYAFPALSLGPFLFPLAPDGLLIASFAAGIGGTLDATGHGSVTVPIPNNPALHGVAVNASGVVYDPAAPLGIGCVLTHVGFPIQ